MFFQQKEHMESNKNLVLVGMMGSGKSTIGYLLSKKLNIKFVDIDRYIEKEVGLKITDIFHKKGENYFREIVEIPYLKGDSVKVVSGPFIDFNGTVDEVYQDKQKVKVVVSIFGRPTPVELDFFQIEMMK